MLFKLEGNKNKCNRFPNCYRCNGVAIELKYYGIDFCFKLILNSSRQQ